MRSYFKLTLPVFLGIFILLLGSFCPIQAQYKVTFHITQLPSYSNSDSGIYIAGSFNSWNPSDQQFQVKENTIVIQMPKGDVEYKFTRGDWQHVETSEYGTSIENRKAQIEREYYYKCSDKRLGRSLSA